jgi:uncharacterized protein (DUF1015 family)
MADIFAFRAVRPAEDQAEKVASVPYDVVNRAEAKELAGDNKASFLRVVRPEIDFDDSVSPYADEVYAKASENLQNMIQSGVLFQEKDEALYVYKQKMGEHEQYGLVACVPAQDYFDDKIKKHELTRKDKEEDRTRHVLELNANTGPVFLTYKDEGQYDVFSKAIAGKSPVYDFTAPDGIGHTVWVIEDAAEIAGIRESFVSVPCSYIADGHHRSAAGAIAARTKGEQNPNHQGDEEYTRYLAILFPHDQLKILDYNRAVKSLNGLSKDEFMAKVAEVAEVREIADLEAPAKTHEISMYIDGQWYGLTIKEELYANANVVEALDVDLLQKNVLAPVLGIDDPRTHTGIDFVGGIRGLQELKKLVDQGTHAVAFAMFPTSIQELMDIADAGEIMPPKSTWFEPKLRSGLMVHLLD